MRVVLVHDWLNGMRGGEKVLEALAAIFPKSRIYTLFCDPETISADLRRHEIFTSFIQRMPKRRTHYRSYLPLFPCAIEKFRFQETDLVISSSHCVAKGARVGQNTLHICYCHSPMRYIWDRFDDYFPRSEMNALKFGIVRVVAGRLRKWDLVTSKRVDLFIANSSFVQRRINEYYGRPARVIYPPVDTDFFTPGSAKREGYFLTASALVPYKKVGLLIKAFEGVKEKLVVIGDGPEFQRLVKEAPPNVSFAGWVDPETLRDYYRGCRALIFPGVEDFGIVPVEAQACGKPVIAYALGGVTDSVVGPDSDCIGDFNGPMTGLFFKSQTLDAIRRAVKVFPGLNFDCQTIRENALRFSRERFFAQMQEFLTDAVGIFRQQGKRRLEELLIR